MVESVETLRCRVCVTMISVFRECLMNRLTGDSTSAAFYIFRVLQEKYSLCE